MGVHPLADSSANALLGGLQGRGGSPWATTGAPLVAPIQTAGCPALSVDDDDAPVTSSDFFDRHVRGALG